jgi:hypothetical protein
MLSNECQPTWPLELGHRQYYSASADLGTIVVLLAPVTEKLPNKPLKRDYPTFFSNLSSHSLMPISCSISASWCSQKSRS